jgi:hypothetical protein
MGIPSRLYIVACITCKYFLSLDNFKNLTCLVVHRDERSIANSCTSLSIEISKVLCYLSGHMNPLYGLFGIIWFLWIHYHACVHFIHTSIIYLICLLNNKHINPNIGFE